MARDHPIAINRGPTKFTAVKNTSRMVKSGLLCTFTLSNPDFMGESSVSQTGGPKPKCGSGELQGCCRGGRSSAIFASALLSEPGTGERWMLDGRLALKAVPH